MHVLRLISFEYLDLYGGALSAAGAGIRNAGDCIAQAAASCRFKTGTELVIDELREAGTCLDEASGKLEQAIEEAEVDNRQDLVEGIGKSSSFEGAKARGFQKAKHPPAHFP